MHPDSILSIFGQQIYLYGVCIAVGILACFFVLFFYAKKRGIPDKLQDFIFIVGIVAIAVGFLAAKLFQAVYNWLETGVFNFYSAGITAMGGFIGGGATFVLVYFGIGALYFKDKEKNLHVKHFHTLALIAPLCIVIAHAFGRIGCLFSGCCHGAYFGSSYVFGGVYMRASDTGIWGYYVPTQLYEAIFLFLLFSILSVMYFKGINLTHAVYLISYGVWRIIIEIFRTDPRGAAILGLAPSQWQSILFIAGGIAIIVVFILLEIPFKEKRKS